MTRVTLIVVVGVLATAASVGCSGDDTTSAPDASTSDDGGATEAAADAVAEAAGDAGPCPAPEQTTAVDDSQAPQLTIAGDVGSVAIADPSIYYPPNAPAGALSFSSLPAGQNAQPDQAAIGTHVAVSNDAGKTWTYVATANQPASTTPPPQTCPDAGACSASIVNETSSIVYDPTDVAARRWKLFTHRYVVVRRAGLSDLILYTDGHIGLYTAAQPAGPWSAPEVAVGWPGTAFSQGGAAYLSTSDPGTTACGAFGEPGATVAPDGSLHLALGCIQPPFSKPTIDIVLLRSTDHAKTWSYLATPLRGADGACFGGDGQRVNAADLFTLGTTEYLMATPELASTGRLGCVVVPFADPAAGVLRRDGAGAVLAARLLAPQFSQSELAHYAGACTYGEGATATGYTMSHLLLETAKPPQLHAGATGVVAP